MSLFSFTLVCFLGGLSISYSALSDSDDGTPPSSARTSSVGDLQTRLAALQNLLKDVQDQALQGASTSSAAARTQTQDISDPEHLEGRPKSAKIFQKIERETQLLHNQIECEINGLFESDGLFEKGKILQKFLDRLAEIDRAHIKCDAQRIEGQVSAEVGRVAPKVEKEASRLATQAQREGQRLEKKFRKLF